MALPKHLRARWRYLALEIRAWPDATFEKRDLQRAVWRAVRGLYGDAGSATVGLDVLRFDHQDGRGRAVVRTRRGEEDRARAAVATVDAIGEDPVGLRVRGTSGTIRTCEEKYLPRGPEAAQQRHVVFEDAEQYAVVHGGAVDVCTDGAFTGATTLDLR